MHRGEKASRNWLGDVEAGEDRLRIGVEFDLAAETPGGFGNISSMGRWLGMSTTIRSDVLGEETSRTVCGRVRSALEDAGGGGLRLDRRGGFGVVDCSISGAAARDRAQNTGLAWPSPRWA